MTASEECTPYRACPRCGSEWFVASKNGRRAGFRLNAQLDPEWAGTHPTGSEEPIDLDRLRCGACSWQGAAHALTQSNM